MIIIAIIQNMLYVVVRKCIALKDLCWKMART